MSANLTELQAIHPALTSTMNDGAASDSIAAVTILGIPVHRVTRADTLNYIVRFMREPRLHQIATVNPEFVMTAQTDNAFRQILLKADLCLPDGIGLVYASRRLGRPLPERVPGSELVYDLAQLAAQEGWPVFLLGAAPGVAKEAAAVLTEKYPGMDIAGTYSGSPAPEENDDIVIRISESGAQILLVAFGAPRQDKWIARNREVLDNVRVAIGVGGSLDFITGRSRRAPGWVQDLGLEWLHRLINEPWRWRRMLALPRFATAVLLSRSDDPTRPPSDTGF